MNSICIIGVYFGNFPKYFDLWKVSCLYNKNIDFIVFNDLYENQCHDNIKFIKIDIEEMKIRASRILGFPVRLEKAYKCCDYKPLYGLIFQEYLKGYDYWGHCDFDMIFGDIKYFCDKYNFKEFDKFLTLGHLTLYRNTDEVNYRFKCQGSYFSYSEAFTMDEIAVFDERRGIDSIYIKNNYSMFTRCIFADVASVYSRFRLIEEYKFDEKPKNYKYQIFSYENGRIFREYYMKGEIIKEEYMYIHFKKRPNFSIDFDYKKYRSFYITKFGFIPKIQNTTLPIIKRYNPYPGGVYEYFEKTRNKSTKKIKEYINILCKKLK